MANQWNTSGVADEDLSSSQYLGVERDTSSNNRLQIPASNPRQSVEAIGVVIDNLADAAGDPVKVTADGLGRVTAGGTLNPGDLVTLGADGKAYKALPGDVLFGQYLPGGIKIGGTSLPTVAAGSECDVNIFANKATRLAYGGIGRATFDATGGKAIGAHTLDLYVPDNAVIIRTWYDVLTTFTSATDAGTIALHANSANDIKSAVAISNGGNPWDAGLHEGIQDGAVANAVKTTAQRQVTATVAVEALTAGVLVLFVEWHLSA